MANPPLKNVATSALHNANSSRYVKFCLQLFELIQGCHFMHCLQTTRDHRARYPRPGIWFDQRSPRSQGDVQ